MKAVRNFYLGLIYSKKKGPILIPLLLFLQVLSFFYLLAIKLLRYHRVRNRVVFDIPVISVGNITWGGSGKTPLVIEIAGYLVKRGIKVAVVQHGRYYQDEVEMVKDTLGEIKVVHKRSKLDSIRKVREEGWAEVVILDDGFQQWGIKKDLEILCLNYRAPFGNRHLIPRGDLREELSEIGRADLIMLNKVSQLDEGYHKLLAEVKKYNSRAEVVTSRYELFRIRELRSQEKKEPQALRGLAVALLTAVADPVSVKEMLSQIGMRIKQEFIYPDHHKFSERDLAWLKSRLDPKLGAIVFTQKDYVKIRPRREIWLKSLNSWDLLVVEIKLKFLRNEEALFRRLNFLLDNLSLQRPI